YALALSLVNVPRWRFDVGDRKNNRFSNHDRDWHKAQTTAATRQGFAGAKDSHRHDRSERFCDHKPQSRLCRLQITIERPRAFRENQRCVSRLENTNQGFKRAAVDSFLINWDYIQLG